MVQFGVRSLLAEALRALLAEVVRALEARNGGIAYGRPGCGGVEDPDGAPVLAAHQPLGSDHRGAESDLRAAELVRLAYPALTAALRPGGRSRGRTWMIARRGWEQNDARRGHSSAFMDAFVQHRAEQPAICHYEELTRAWSEIRLIRWRLREWSFFAHQRRCLHVNHLADGSNPSEGFFGHEQGAKVVCGAERSVDQDLAR